MPVPPNTSLSTFFPSDPNLLSIFALPLVRLKVGGRDANTVSCEDLLAVWAAIRKMTVCRYAAVDGVMGKWVSCLSFLGPSPPSIMFSEEVLFVRV